MNGNNNGDDISTPDRHKRIRDEAEEAYMKQLLKDKNYSILNTCDNFKLEISLDEELIKLTEPTQHKKFTM